MTNARRRHGTAGLTLQMRPHGPAEATLPPLRVGFTASKAVGNAVARNRAKRRLRALAAELLPGRTRPGHDLVLVARPETLDRPWDLLKQDLHQALARLRLSSGEDGR